MGGGRLQRPHRPRSCAVGAHLIARRALACITVGMTSAALRVEPLAARVAQSAREALAAPWPLQTVIGARAPGCG